MIISTINLKGGVGKTTTAIALATAAVRDGKDVELYDCDPQSSASLWAMMAEEAGDSLPFPLRPPTSRPSAWRGTDSRAPRTNGSSLTARPTGASWTRRRTAPTSSSSRPRPDQPTW